MCGKDFQVPASPSSQFEAGSDTEIGFEGFGIKLVFY